MMAWIRTCFCQCLFRLTQYAAPLREKGLVWQMRHVLPIKEYKLVSKGRVIKEPGVLQANKSSVGERAVLVGV